MADVKPNPQLTLVEQLQRLRNQALDTLGVKPSSSLFIKSLNGEVLTYKHFLPKSKEEEFIDSFIVNHPTVGFLEIERVQTPNDLYSAKAAEIEQELWGKGIPQEFYEQHKISSYIYEVRSQKKYPLSKAENSIEQVQLAAVQKIGTAIQYIDSPSEQVQLAAVQKIGTAIQYIDSPSEQVQLAAVQKNGTAIQYIDSPSEQVQLAAVQQNGRAIECINAPSEQVQLAAVQKNGTAIQYIDSPSEQVQLAAVQQNWIAIENINTPSEQVQLAAVQIDGYAVKFIEHPIETIQLVAVQQNPDAIKYIQKPSKQVRLAAIKDAQTKVEAIQILQGNAPEQIFEERFKQIRDQFSYAELGLNEAINDAESGITYNKSRLLSDSHYAKRNIQGSAQFFASEIKKTLSPKELLFFAPDLDSPSNLPLDKTPTTEETLSLFSNQYVQKEFSSAVFENENIGQYELQKPTIQYQHKSLELLQAGTHPYSPNYKEVFDKAGLKEEFNEFEKACCERSKWNGSYNYAIQAHDIAEIGDLERKLPALNERIENSRDLVYNKFNDLYFNIEIRNNIENKLSHEETEILGSMQRTGSISYQKEDLLRKFNFSAEKEELKELLAARELGADNDGELYSNEAKVRMKAGHILEENGLLPKGTTIHELTEEGWKHGFIKDVQVKLEKEASSSGNLINTSTEKTGNYLATQMQDLKYLADNYRNLGYDSVAEAINEYVPNYTHIIDSGSSLNYKIENVEIQAAGAKKLYGDIAISNNTEKPAVTLENLHIKDKATGLKEPLQTNGINICEQPADTVKKLLSGGKQQVSSGILGLNKTPLGWGITIGKQLFSSADSSSGIG